MLAHDLAVWLLKCPNEEVRFVRGHDTFDPNEMVDLIPDLSTREIITTFSDGGGWDSDIFEVEFRHDGGAHVAIVIGDVEEIKERGNGSPSVLDGPCSQPEWGTSDGRITEVLMHLLEIDAQR